MRKIHFIFVFPQQNKFMDSSGSLWDKNKEELKGIHKQTGIKIVVFLLAFIQSRIKSNGFQLENIHFKVKEKIELRYAFAALGYAYCIKEGIMEIEKKGKIPLKRYKDQKKHTLLRHYPEICVFLLGYDALENQIFKPVLGSPLIH